VTWAVFDHRGLRIATANAGGLVELWSPDGTRLATLTGHGSTVVQDVEFSPDGRFLLSAANDRTARVWDLSAHREVRRVTHKDSVDAAVFDTTGARFATGSEDKSAILWNLASGTPIRAFPHESQVRSVVVDDRILGGATSSGTIQLWDIASGREAVRFRHAASAQAIDLDHDRLLTTAYDGRIVVWDIASSVGTVDQVVAFTCSTVDEGDVTTRRTLQCARGKLPDGP
jgi:WD40 repeat protein